MLMRRQEMLQYNNESKITRTARTIYRHRLEENTLWRMKKLTGAEWDQ